MSNNHMNVQDELQGIVQSAIDVITKPRDFFSRLSSTGGFLSPLIFMVVMGVVAGLILSVLSLVNLTPVGAVAAGLASFIIMPIVIAVFGFVGAAVLFVIWKLTGSQKSYETAYRGMAYTSAILPITTVLDLIPYLGGIIGLLWMTYLLVIISSTMHAINEKKAWTVFGIICAVLILLSVSAETASRKMARDMQTWEMEMRQKTSNLDALEEMSPEEAGQALGDFFKGMQETAGDHEK
ncbi:MAG: YIP1 family protein [Desulfonatronovibrio sp.]